ncbi:MAG: SDR family oxidoreductase [Deltaproteobacteria bacterium]|nr:SDR family oxidoreductase [Deltaproteobacteria bacterium]
MTTFVTGASGHIGGNLVRALLAEGRKVRVLVRDDTRAIDGLDVEQVRGDILQPAALAAATKGSEVVYHLAGHISVAGDPGGLMHRTNTEGTRNVVAACLDAGVRRLVHFSSIHALSGNPVDEVVDENKPLAESGDIIAYDRTKALGEREIIEGVDKGLDAVTVNPGAVLGPHDYKPSPMGKVVLDLCRRKMPALIDGGFGWVDVRDVVQGALAAEKKGRIGERYLLTGHWLSTAALGDLVEEVSGVKRPRFVSPMWLAMVGAPFVTAASRLTGKRPLYTLESLKVLRNHRHVSHQKATDELDFSPRPTLETIADTYEWFKQVGIL